VAPNVQFDTTLLTQAQAAMDVAHSECASLNTAMNQFTADLQGGWKGQASSTFNGVYAEFSSNYAKVVQGLQRLQENLNSAAKTLGINEQSVQEHAQSIAGTLNAQINSGVNAAL
jgi:WXG100 family type VII secretion target